MDNLVDSSIQRVFTTMVDMVVEPGDSEAMKGKESTAASVGFAGDRDGVVYLYFVEPLDKVLCTEMVGLEPEELDETIINDVLGEIANMVVGQIKTILCDRGFACSLSIPSILRGVDLSVYSSSTKKKSASFSVNGHPFGVEFFVKAENN